MTTPYPLPEQTRTIVVANQKGGVGKTTTTVNLGAALVEHGARVLVVDLDPQGNASTALGIDKHDEDMLSIYDVLINGKSLDDAMQETAFSKNLRETDGDDAGGLHCVPATIDLAGAEIELVSMHAREQRLKNALNKSETSFDYVLLDCPPSLGNLTTNALTAAQEILIPIQCEFYALEGVAQLTNTVALVQQHLNPDIHISTVLLTMHNGTRLAGHIEEEVRTHFPEQTLKTRIPRSVRTAEAPSYGQTLIEYAPTRPAALAYVEAARELAERGAK